MSSKAAAGRSQRLRVQQNSKKVDTKSTPKLTGGAPGKENDSLISSAEATPKLTTMTSKAGAKSPARGQQVLPTPHASRPKRAIKMTEKAKLLLEEKTPASTPVAAKSGKVLPIPVTSRAAKSSTAKRGTLPAKATPGNISKKQFYKLQSGKFRFCCEVFQILAFKYERIPA